MADKQTKLSIVVDAENRAARGLNAVQGQLKGMDMSVERISSTLKNMGRVGAVAFTALSAASGKLVKDAADSLQIEESFRRMTEQAGISADRLLEQLQATSAGTVSATDLMLSANRAMALGVGEDMETVTRLMEIARLKGRALGLTTTQAFNDIVTGIGRGSPLILDNLGITIKLGEAQEMYAQKLGKTAAELTDNEKRQALLNAVMERGNQELQEAGQLQTTTAEKMQTLRATMSDAADNIGRTLIPAVTKLLEAITPVLEKVAVWVEENPRLSAAIIGVALAATALLAVLGAIGIILPGIIAAFTLFSGTAGVVMAAIGALGFAIFKIIKIIQLLKNDWDNVWLGIKLMTVDAANGIMSIVESMVNFVIDKVNFVIRQINKVIRAANKVPGIDRDTIGELDSVSLNRFDRGNVVENSAAYRNSFSTPAAPLYITGNTFLSEDAAEEMGDMIMSKLKLSNAL